MKRLVWVALFGLSAACSSSRYVIPPTELLKFNGVASAQSDTRRAHTSALGVVVVEQSAVVHIRTISGQLIELGGAVPVTVVTTDGREFRYVPPIEAHFADNALTIHSSNSVGRTFQVDELKKVEIEAGESGDDL